MSVDDTIKERTNHHGSFQENSDLTVGMLKVMQNSTNWQKFSSIQKTAIFHILHKLARIGAGDNNYADHWHDIGGYAKLVEDSLSKVIEGPISKNVGNELDFYPYICEDCQSIFTIKQREIRDGFCPACWNIKLPTKKLKLRQQPNSPESETWNPAG